MKRRRQSPIERLEKVKDTSTEYAMVKLPGKPLRDVSEARARLGFYN